MNLAHQQADDGAIPFLPEGQPVPDTLMAVASEVGQLAEISERLQGFISQALVADSARNITHLREFQAIDLLVQRLQGVSAFLQGLSQTADPSWRIDADAAAKRISLAELAARLSGAPVATPHSEDASASDGDFELFG